MTFDFGSGIPRLAIGLALSLYAMGQSAAAGVLPSWQRAPLVVVGAIDPPAAAQQEAGPPASDPQPAEPSAKEPEESSDPADPGEESRAAEADPDNQPSEEQPEAQKPPEEKPEDKGAAEKKSEELRPEEQKTPGQTPAEDGESKPIAPPTEEMEEGQRPAEGEKQGAEKEDSKKGDQDNRQEDQPASLPERLLLDEFVVIPKAGSYGRAAIQIDPIEAALARGEWKFPEAGDTFRSAEGRTLRWRTGKVEDPGLLATQAIAGGGYAVTAVDSPADGIMLLRATGHAAVYVNGQLHAGDVYQLGNFDLPVEIRKGRNELVFHVYQPELRAELIRPDSSVLMVPERLVAPTPLIGREERVWIGMPVVNATSSPVADAKLVAQVEGGETIETPLPWTDSATFYHASFEVAIPASATSRTLPVQIQLRDGDTVLATRQIELSMVEAHEVQLRTFRSQIDGSVQSYAIRPASDTAPASELVSDEAELADAKGAIVALHGLGSSAREFIDHYATKSWAHVIAPSGRGDYGFDWEDWSRRDALEALADAESHFAIDPARIYLSGYAAGGHGALVLGSSEPNRFAAIATSGAWSTLWSYGGGRPQYADPTPPQEMLLRCANPSATDRLFINLRGCGVYAQHGSEDKQVPLAEARVLMQALASVHDDYKFRERLGADSWWDDETLDDKSTMEFFATRQVKDDDPDVVELATFDLATVSRRDWVAIGAQGRPFQLSTLRAARKEGRRPTIEITTENVERLYLTKGAVPPRTPFTVRIDGSRPIQLRGVPASGEIWFARRGNQWARVLSDDKLKGPHRAGGFKEIFTNDPLLVYGTKGTAEETAWAKAKARFDAESFYYRGGGSLEVIPDTQFAADRDRDRNVVIYGNADTNGAWPALLSLSPVQVRRDHVQVDLRPEADSALGVLLVRPRPDSTTALVGVVGGTNVEGMRLTSRLRYFMAGVHYPDLVILGPDTLADGDSDLRAAGFFTTDWEVSDDDLVWRDLAL